jgi:hypothetical protein
MMAGAEASARAAAELGNTGGPKAAGQSEGQFPDPGDGQPADDQPQGEGEGRAEGQGKTQKPSEGKASPKSSNGGGSKRGEFKLNDELKKGSPQLAGDPSQPGDTRVPNAGPRDADAAARVLGNEPWFAKLPPDLRKAIRAKAQRPPPRSYEEKLQKYFESID